VTELFEIPNRACIAYEADGVTIGSFQ
jgi:hypothetical protein